MSGYRGDFSVGATVRFMFNTFAVAGESITRATNGEIRVYKDDSITQSTAGLSDNEDFDGLTGVHLVEIDTTADDTFYAAGHDYLVVMSAATIDGKTINAAIGEFSIQNRYDSTGITTLLSRLTSTRAGYLDNLSGGAAATAADVWANATRTLTSAVNLGAIDVTLVEAESYVARLDFTLYKRVDYVTGARAGTVRFRYNINLSGATVKLVGAFRGRGEGQDINITGSAAVDPDDSSYYIVEFSVPTSVSDAWGTGDKAYLYEVRAYKNSIDDVLQRGWISVPDSPPVNAN